VFLTNPSLESPPNPVVILLMEMEVRVLGRCAAILAVSATLLLGCGKRPTAYHKLSAVLPGGRVVSVTSDSAVPRLDIQAKAGPTMQVSDKLIVLLPQQVMVDGQPVGDIPADTRHIKIVDRDGTVDITAGDTMIYHFLR
jgi:hypothetical protein